MITNANQRGKYVYIYNENGSQVATIQVANSKESGLIGFTSQTVSVQQGLSIVTYNEKGYEVGSPIYAYSIGNEPPNSSIPNSSTPKTGFISRVKNVIFLLSVFAVIYYLFR